MTQKILQYY